MFGRSGKCDFVRKILPANLAPIENFFVVARALILYSGSSDKTIVYSLSQPNVVLNQIEEN